MKRSFLFAGALTLLAAVTFSALGQRPTPSGRTEQPSKKLYKDNLNVNPPHVSTDRALKWDYPIVYVRAPRFGDKKNSAWAEVGHPTHLDAGADLMVLYPDGKEEVLVEGGDGSVADPMVSFDGEWVFFAKFHNLKKDFAPYGGLSVHGADIYKIHVKSRKTVRLTSQQFTPNLGAADWSAKFGGTGKDTIGYGVFNLGPCPLPGGNDPYQGLDPFNSGENGAVYNWTHQGADAGKYSNSDIHAVRILAMEPTTDRVLTAPQGSFYNHARERLRILGEVPVRKIGTDGKQPLDPDGNPDTSFLAKVPANVAWTFQTLDRRGMVLNMAQTWHQVRPGEIRNDCGGCHAHSQKPTAFAETAAAKPDYQLWDLTERAPLMTAGKNDEPGLRYEKGVKDVEFYRDVKPILDRSCAACHTGKVDQPAGNLVLDDDKPIVAVVNYLTLPSGTYYRLAADGAARFGHKPVIGYGWRYSNASRYVRMFQSRRSLLIWKIFGERLDGWSNDDLPTETTPGDATTLHWKGKPIANTTHYRNLADLDYTGSIMPPPEAVKAGKVKPLTAEDRLTLVRWIDLGCPIELDFDRKGTEARGYGWRCDDNRPTLALTYPEAGTNRGLSRLVVGMHDYGTGLDLKSFQVRADFAVDDAKPGEDLAAKFRPGAPGVWELKLAKPLAVLPRGKLTVSVKDRQGNVARVERTFSVAAPPR